MARVNVYLPDGLAGKARKAGLNVSAITQEALATALTEASTDAWLASIVGRPERKIAHQAVLDALDVGRNELTTRHG